MKVSVVDLFMISNTLLDLALYNVHLLLLAMWCSISSIFSSTGHGSFGGLFQCVEKHLKQHQANQNECFELHIYNFVVLLHLSLKDLVNISKGRFLFADMKVFITVMGVFFFHGCDTTATLPKLSQSPDMLELITRRDTKHSSCLNTITTVIICPASSRPVQSKLGNCDGVEAFNDNYHETCLRSKNLYQNSTLEKLTVAVISYPSSI
ncbi:hypothetical protein C4D60_Mb11t16250 [Musa balbisiana]|uniref:Uncharacterized protein n=1 Tax=Musa balbisiana TaxID=52838 RepID=A0A4S8J4K5_MUSBA|nr:hypothetical protein C4D60_Mb11t16250 [Musa balbisiana]